MAPRRCDNNFNSSAPGRSECDAKNVIFNLVLLIGIFRPSHDNALRWMPQDLTDHKSTLVQVMAWCHQATSHYLSQCWLSSLLPYGVARPQRVKSVILESVLWIDILSTFCEFFSQCVRGKLIVGLYKSILFQVMAWCHLSLTATRYYQSQCWPRCLSYRWLSGRIHYLHCQCTGDTTVLH